VGPFVPVVALRLSDMSSAPSLSGSFVQATPSVDPKRLRSRSLQSKPFQTSTCTSTELVTFVQNHSSPSHKRNDSQHLALSRFIRSRHNERVASPSYRDFGGSTRHPLPFGVSVQTTTYGVPMKLLVSLLGRSQVCPFQFSLYVVYWLCHRLLLRRSIKATHPTKP